MTSRAPLLFRPQAEVESAEWDALVEGSDDAWLFHRSAWLAAEAVLSPQRGFGVLEDERLVGACPLIAFDQHLAPGRLKVLASGGLFATGPALRGDLAPDRRMRTERAVFAHLKTLAGSGGFDLLVVRMPPLSASSLEQRANPLLAHGFMPHCLYGGPRYWGHAPLTRIMDLSGDRDSRLATASARCRTQVRAAQRSGLPIETVEYRAGWRRFRALQESTYRRTGAAVWPEPFFEKLEAVAEAMTVYFVRGEGEDQAALWVCRHGTGATYFASATDYEGEARHGAALQYHAMDDVKARGCRYYQIGPYFPYMGTQEKMFRIGEFKRRLGGTDHALHEGTLLRRPLKHHVLLAANLALAALRGRA